MADRIVGGGRARDFAEFLTDLDHGSVNQKLSEKLAQVSDAVGETGKTGKVTLVIKVSKDGEMAMVTADIKATKPEHPAHGTLFYFGLDAQLVREDPRQLKLREVVAAPAKFKSIKDEKKPVTDEEKE